MRKLLWIGREWFYRFGHEKAFFCAPNRKAPPTNCGATPGGASYASG
jgi:hypothetical protein